MKKKEREEMILEAVLDGAIPRDENDRVRAPLASAVMELTVCSANVTATCASK
jgi:hypothetical protein